MTIFKCVACASTAIRLKPVYVDEFAMILRKYETYRRDSSTVYRFDSLRFTDNKVRLSNFTIRSMGTEQN